MDNRHCAWRCDLQPRRIRGQTNRRIISTRFFPSALASIATAHSCIWTRRYLGRDLEKQPHEWWKRAVLR